MDQGPLDTERFGRLAEEYAARLYAVAFRMLGGRADAEDAVQRTLLNCYAARASYSPRFALSTWLYRALTNVCIDELRKRTTRRAAAPPIPPASRPDAAEHLDLTRTLARVPTEARMLLALHYVDGLSTKELAAVRGISINTVKSQLARGKAILRRALAEQEGRHGSR